MCNIIAGTMSLSFDYQRQSWHLVLFYLVGTVLFVLRSRADFGRPPYLLLELWVRQLEDEAIGSGSLPALMGFAYGLYCVSRYWRQAHPGTLNTYRWIRVTEGL